MPPPKYQPPPDPLAAEARRLGRYLIGREPSPELTARYAQAHERLLSAPVSPRDQAWLAYVRRHPWALGPLEAAAGLAAPQSLLRRKIYLMAAVLEASPDHREKFLPESRSAWALPLLLGGLAISAVIKAAAGLILIRFIRPASPAGAHHG